MRLSSFHHIYDNYDIIIVVVVMILNIRDVTKIELDDVTPWSHGADCHDNGENGTEFERSLLDKLITFFQTWFSREGANRGIEI